MEQFGSSSGSPEGRWFKSASRNTCFIRSRSVAVNTPACHAGDRGFDSVETAITYGSVAQLVEQWIEAPCVGSSTLS